MKRKLQQTRFLIKRILPILFFLGSVSLLTAQTQVGSDLDGEATGDISGVSVSCSADGTRIAIGASSNDGNGSTAGHVRIYEESGGMWTQLGSDIDGEAVGDLSGRSVSISADGTRVAIGAHRNDGNGLSAGHVRIYEESGGVWTQIGSDIDGEAAGDFSGVSVSISANGTRVAIGATDNYAGNGDASGHVRIYEESGGVWTQLGNDIDAQTSDEAFGEYVSISDDGTRVAVGAPDALSVGEVRIFEENGGAWTQLGHTIYGAIVSGDDFGESVSISADGKRVAVGAPDNDTNGSNSGQVRIFELIGNASWAQIGGEINGDAASDDFGEYVSLSADGKIVAIGAPDNDGNGSNSGEVRVYEEGGGVWTQIGNDIYGEAAGDDSGVVSLSANGSRVVIGARLNDGNGTGSGHVRVYSLPITLPVDLVYFTAKVDSRKSVELIWQTASEENNAGFEIERSSDARDWQTLNYVAGQGTTDLFQNYDYIDQRPMPGYNYYRLKQIDFDGSFEYSEVRTILMEDALGHKLEVFPNPSDGKFTLGLHNPNGKRANIKLFDSTGSMIWEERFSNEEVQPYWEQKFDLPQHEVYFIVTQIGDQKETKKVIIIDKK